MKEDSRITGPRQAGDVLTAGEWALLLMMEALLCELTLALRDGSKLPPELLP